MEARAQEGCPFDLSSIQRPDLRDEEGGLQMVEEDDDIERNVMRVLENNRKEEERNGSLGQWGHFFDEMKRKQGEEEEMSKEEEKQVLERRRLILKLRAYLSAFPEVLKPVLGNQDLEKITLKELKGLLLDVKFTVACKNMCKVNTWSAEGLLSILEGFLEAFTPIRAQGLHTLALDPDFIDVVKEITLEHMDFMYSRPELRALFLICNKLCTLHFAGPSHLPNQKGMDRLPSEEMLAIAREMGK